MSEVLALLLLLLDKVVLLAGNLSCLPNAGGGRLRWRGGAPRLQRGDLLEVERTLFVHFGIYLGEGRVAHLIPDALPLVTREPGRVGRTVTNTRLLLGVLCRTAAVRVDSVEEFAYGAPLRRNTLDRDRHLKALAGDEVARRAEGLLGSFPYSLLWNNCEHFATHCRYDAAVSYQTDKFCDYLKCVIRDQRSILLTALLGMMSIVYHGVGPSTTLPTVLIPFTLWMAG